MYNIDKITSKTFSIEADIILQDEIINISSSDTVSLSLTKDFLNQMMPLTFFTFGINDYISERIVTNKETVKFNIKLLINMGNNFNKTVFNKTFIPILDEEQINSLKTKVNGKTDKNEARFNTFSLYLFEEKSFEAVKKNFNLIFKDTTIPHASLFILSKLNHMDFIVSPFDNISIYNEILLPNLNLKNSILYLQKVYGIYKYGLRFFLDIDRGYMLSKSVENVSVAISEFESWDLYILSGRESTTIRSGSYYDNENKIVYIGKEVEMKVKNSEIVDKYIDAEEYNIVNKSDFNGKREINKQVSIIESDNDSTKIKSFYDPYENPFNILELTFDKQSNSTLITLGMTDINIADLTPNKKYNFIFESDMQKFNGVYRLDSYFCNLNKSDHSLDMTATITATFTKSN